MVDYLREKEMLLILDNFEHLRGGVNVLIEMVRQVSDLKLLVTSRERLNLREEWLFDLEGLLYPDEQGVMDGTININAVDLESYPAVQLFLQGARRIKPNFLIKGKTNSIIKKTSNYIKHYLSVIKYSFSKNYDLIYIHYLTHHIPLLFFLVFKKTPIIINVHGSDVVGLLENKTINRIARMLLKNVYI